jgi:prepilin-type N-terminal cleavage/methylation domain-containing protein
MMRRARQRTSAGFTITELAVVMAVVGLLLGMGMFTLSAQVEQRNTSDTQRRLEDARELLLAFAVVNGRLPCPATANTTGDEAPAAGGVCTSYYGGFLPARTLGFQPVDSAGYAVDAWGNRIRYAVSNRSWGTAMRFTTKATTADPWSMSTTPNDLVVCSASPAAVGSATCDAGTAATNTSTVVALVFSTGKNGSVGGTGLNEARNLDLTALFVYRPPDPPGAAGGEFDDQMVWLPVGVLYSRMVAAGVLP